METDPGPDSGAASGGTQPEESKPAEPQTNDGAEDTTGSTSGSTTTRP